MSDKPTVARAIAGAFRLARFDAAALGHFDNTPEHAIHSFKAAVLVAPLYAGWIITSGSAAEGPLPVVIIYEALVYACGWMLFPVIMWHLLETLDRRDRFCLFVTVYNWVAAVQSFLFFGMMLLIWVNNGSEAARGFFGLALLIYALVYAGFSIKTALSVPVGTAALIVIIDFLISFAWEQFSMSLVG